MSIYDRQVKGVTIDVYDILMAYEVTNPAIAHAIKKLLCAGDRGAKGRLQDLIEAQASISRGINLEAGL